MSISQYAYEELRKRFGSVASWAVWEDPDPCGNANSNIGTQIFDSITINDLNNEYVFIGLNPAGHPQNAIVCDWSAFHSTYSNGKDYILRGALNQPPYRGSYLTDLIKDIEEKDSSVVKKIIKADPSILQRNFLWLEKELALLQDEKPENQKPVLVAMSGDVFRYLKRRFKDYTVKQIHHFSYRFPPYTPSSYRDHVVKSVNFKAITSEKYLQYFLSDNEHRMSDTTMMEFLNDMIVVSESMDTIVPLTEIIKEIMGKCGLDGSLYDGITQIVNGNLLDALTAFEAFTILWFVSCKNPFTYQDSIYLQYANNGVIGKLLKKLV